MIKASKPKPFKRVHGVVVRIVPIKKDKTEIELKSEVPEVKNG